MRRSIAGVLSLAVMCVCGVASADIVYNVDITDGVETVTGTITTDGASGALTAADFLSWSLSASGTVTLSDVGPPVDAICIQADCGIDVVGGTMEFTGNSNNAGLLLIQAVPQIAVVGFFYNGLSVFNPGNAEILVTAPYVIGTVSSVPEPPTAILLGIGLACLGLACTRAQRRWSSLQQHQPMRLSATTVYSIR